MVILNQTVADFYKEQRKKQEKKAAKRARRQARRKPYRKGERVDVLTMPSNEFLNSYAWTNLRMRVLKHYGPKCMCCGATKETGAVINVDHIKPRAKHPELALAFDNLQVLCGVCNKGKANWDETDWRPPVAREIAA